MKKILLAILCLSAISCAKKAEQSAAVGPEKMYRIEKLFTYEDCTIYRFNDVGRYIHYTNCKGQTNSTHSCGKNCTQTDNVNTTIEY